MSLIATLAGVNLSAVGPVGWTFTPGGRPHTRVMEVSQRVADELADKRGQFVTLEIRDATRPPLIVEKLLIVDIRAGKTPYTLAIMIADKRYLWRRKLIVRDFNVRRRTGETRISLEGRIENRQMLPTVAYTPPSLNQGQPYDARACLESVLRELDGTAPSIPNITRQIRIESLYLNDTGDVAVDRMLAHVAGLGVWVDKTGTTRIYDTRDGGEAAVIANAGAPLQGQGYHGRALRAYARPRRLNVFMERECEVRFDITEGDTTNISTVDRGSDGREPRTLENVVFQPDASLVVNGATVGRGTILEFNTWLTALAALGTVTRTTASGEGELTQEQIRKRYMQWHYLVGRYGTKTNGFPDPEWRQRLTAVRNCWRKMFRVLPKWRDKMRSMRPYRVSKIDPTTGTGTKSEAYMDYLSKPSAGAMNQTISRNPDIGYQISGWATNLKDGSVAPALVNIPDPETGVIQIVLQADPWGDAEALAPGNVANLPTHRVGGDFTDAARKSFLAWGIQPLQATFKLAVVVSCIQAAPNDSSRYHKVTVDPARASQVLGVEIGECLGPEASVFIPGGDLTARFAWSDDFASQIEGAFFTGSPMPDTLLVNADAVKAVAEATAAREWATYLDREEATMSVAINPDVEIAGAIAMVDHSILPGGPPVTTIMTMPEIQPPARDAFVPKDIQNVIRHLVQP